MKFSLETHHAAFQIHGYSESGIMIGDKNYTQHLIVSSEAIFTDWQPPTVDMLSISDFSSIFDWQLEVLLLGTGSIQQFPPPQLFADFAQMGIGLEVMGIAATCRTYNVLISENRRAAAALMLY